LPHFFFKKIPEICVRSSIGSNSAESSFAEYQQNRPSGPSTESKPSTRGISNKYGSWNMEVIGSDGDGTWKSLEVMENGDGTWKYIIRETYGGGGSWTQSPILLCMIVVVVVDPIKRGLGKVGMVFGSQPIFPCTESKAVDVDYLQELSF
jgi:hypothetical protein